jgi:hypothetical protein
VIEWFKTNRKLKKEVRELEYKIKLMQEHIVSQKDENLRQKREINDLKKLLDIAENVKRY